MSLGILHQSHYNSHMNPVISYAITAATEVNELTRLLRRLSKYKHSKDEIVVQIDQSKGCHDIETVCESFVHVPNFKWVKESFSNHFSEWKNTLNSHCSGQWIFNIDADEMPTGLMVSILHYLLPILAITEKAELFRVPRINTVDGVSEIFIKQNKWSVNKKGWINWPDYQDRIYKNKPEIRWVKPVHERIEGAALTSELSAKWGWLLALRHAKTFERQQAQNQFYDQL